MSAPLGTRPRCVVLVPETNDAGAENQARYLIDGLRGSAEFDVTLAYFEPGRAHETFLAGGVPSVQAPRRRRLRADLVGRPLRLRRAVGSPPDLLHTWLPEGNIIGLLAALGWRGTRVVISQRGSWNELDTRFHARLQRLLLPRANHAISNSPGGARVLEEMGMPAERISVIANGVPLARLAIDADPAELRRRHGWDRNPVVAWVGRGDARALAHRDLPTLYAAIAALRRTHPNAELAMIGPTGEELRAAGHEPPEWADPLGWIAAPAAYLRAADAVVISSRIEGNSNVAGEAMMLGTPVVSTDCGAHCELVAAASGRVVPVGSPEMLAEALAQTLADPPDREAVSATAREALSVERMVRETTDVYRRVLGRLPGQPVPSRP